LSLRRKTSHALPLLHCESSSHGRQFSTNFSNVSPSHRLQPQTVPPWVLPMGCSSSGTGCSSMGPPQGHKPCQQTCSSAPVWAPLSTGLQVLAGACSSVGFPQGHSFLQASTLSGVGSLPQATGGDLLHCGPPWTTGEQPASSWSSSRVAREESLLQHFEHLLPPPSSLALVSAELFLS